MDLKCVGCGQEYDSNESNDDTPRGVSIADLVCPVCHENLIRYGG